METVEHLIVGAGPAGLRAAQVLAQAGREVLVAEKRALIGPKTCAGGLTLKAVRLLEALGLPPSLGLSSVGEVAFAGGASMVLDPERTTVRTVGRDELGCHQVAWARAAGATVASAAPVSQIDLRQRRAVVGGRPVSWRHLIGADGSDSAVRRALGLPCPRSCFAGEYNLAGRRAGPLRVECDPGALGNGYFWVFPHIHYTSIGAVAPKHLVAPARLKRYVEERMAGLGVLVDAPFEGATLEVDFRGFHFPGGVHLTGDAAGVASSLTAEGIYSALVTGEEVARTILEPRFDAPRTAAWLRVKRRHDRLSRLLAVPAVRRPVLSALARLARRPELRTRMADWFLAA